MFIRYILHEIRNPLNSVQLGLESLEEEMIGRGDSMARLDVLRDVKACLQASITTLNDMLTSDKIRSGILCLERTDVNLIPLLSAIVERHKYQVFLYQYYIHRYIFAFVYARFHT